MTSHMAREVREIPQASRRFLAESRVALEAAATAMRATDPGLIVTVARGSSDHAATYLKYAVELLAGVPVASVGPSVASVYRRPLRLGGAACVGISQSGRSPDIVEMMRAAGAGGALTVAITNFADSPMAQASAHCLPLLAGVEQSVAATKTFVTSVVAGLALVADFRVASAAARFCVNFNRLGFHPGFGLSATLPRLVGPQAAARLFYLGERIDGLAADRIARRGLALVPEGRKVFPNLSVHENLELGAFTRGRERRALNLEKVYATFPRLKERTTQLAGTLSGGEQQMLAIGRGLMAEPRLLILDEPSLGLSPLLVEEMFALIGRLRQDGLAILLVEQNVGQSLDIADQAYVLENGLIRFAGLPAELLASETLRQAYLGM